jgi:UDP-3-O-[3-hydroxymyristoyl] glucosamine N-acyltransferase
MPVTVGELAELIGGGLEGDGTILIDDARSLDRAGPGHITFVENARNARILADCRAGAVVVPESISIVGRTVIRVKDPFAAFFRIAARLRGPAVPPPAGIDPRAAVHPTVRLGPDCSVQPFACIGEGSTVGARCQFHPGVVVGRECRIGDDVTLYPGAVLYDRTTVGDRSIVHANTVLGADGFGYRTQDGIHVKVPQLGHVEVGEDVEIGACSTIDRGTFDATTIGPGTKIDNLVMVAHNCQIGPHNLFVAQVGVAGSSTTGSHVVIAGQAGVSDHIRVGDRVIIGSRSAVSCDLPSDGRYLGNPPQPERDAKRVLVTLTKLPEMRQDLNRIKRLLHLDEGNAA